MLARGVCPLWGGGGGEREMYERGRSLTCAGHAPAPSISTTTMVPGSGRPPGDGVAFFGILQRPRDVSHVKRSAHDSVGVFATQ